MLEHPPLIKYGRIKLSTNIQHFKCMKKLFQFTTRDPLFKFDLRMKLTVLLIFISLFGLQASPTYSQKTVTLDLNGVSVSRFLDLMEAQTDYRFVYKLRDVNLERKVDINVNNEEVPVVLNTIFKNTRTNYRIYGNQVFLTKASQTSSIPDLTPNAFTEPQNIKVSGIITDKENGMPIPGANIIEKGTNNGVMSDFDGKYSIEVSPSSVLVFSYVGFVTNEIPVEGKSQINVVLREDAVALDEVVVVGYGTQQKSDVTGSISSISEDSFQKFPVANAAQALQGLGSGITISKSGGNSHPGATPQIRIRGERSLTGNNSPLIVVDGIPFDGSLNDISTNIITDMQILKDASSTAIYGSRGSNGVILITTKSGKQGKTTITYDTYMGFNEALGKYDVFNAEQYIEFKKWATYNRNPDMYNGFDDPNLIEQTFTDPVEMQGYLNGTDTDWQDLIYSSGIVTNHQLGISGGNEKTQFASSIGYFNEEGVYKKQGIERYDVKLRLDHRISNHIKIGINSINSYNILDGVDINPLLNTLQASPLISPYNEDGTLRGFLGNGDGIYNPLADFQDNAIVDERSRLSTFTTGYLNIDFFEGLNYTLNVGVNLSREKQGKFYASNTTKQLGRENFGTNVHFDNLSYTLENIITYDKTIAENHNLNFTGLFSLQENQNEGLRLEYYDVVADYIQYYNPQYSTFRNNSGSYVKTDLLSYMGRLNYDYKGKYLLTLTVRSDGSSQLAPGNKWHTFPSGAIGWNIDKEPFMDNAEYLSSLKLRASYGSVGNSAVGAYQTLGGLSVRNYNFGDANVAGYYPTTATNRNLTWEETTTFNLGLDYGFFHNRINGSVEYYRQHTTNLILDQALPATSGIANRMRTNIGETENKGLEFNLNSVNFSGDGINTLHWSTNFNIFLNRNKILKLSSGVTEDLGNSWFVGKPISSIYQYESLGIWQNTPEDIALAEQYDLTTTGASSVIGTVKIADLNGDGKLDQDDRHVIGAREPDFEGGITNSFAYKNFDLSIIAYFKVGGLVKSQIHDDWTNSLQGTGKNNVDIDYWTPENNLNYWPKPNAGVQIPRYRSTLARADASYLKIRNISLGYSLPDSVLEKLGLQSARIYTSANNIGTFFSEYMDKFDGLDPETNGTVGINTPPMRSFIFGLNVSL